MTIHTQTHCIANSQNVSACKGITYVIYGNGKCKTQLVKGCTSTASTLMVEWLHLVLMLFASGAYNTNRTQTQSAASQKETTSL